MHHLLDAGLLGRLGILLQGIFYGHMRLLCTGLGSSTCIGHENSL